MRAIHAQRVGSSNIVPFIEGEDATARHQRRLRVNLALEPEARQWCQANRVVLRVTNGGHHWRFTRGRNAADWWPSRALMVFNGRWDCGMHVHDVRQALQVLAGRFGLRPAGRENHRGKGEDTWRSD